jgi:hypothetical protein
MPATDATKIQKYGLEERILELSVGRTTTEVSDAITAELQAEGIQDQISQPTVSRFLRKVRAARAEETRNLVQDHIKAHVPKDLEAIEEIESFLLERFRGRLDLSKLSESLAEKVAAIIEGDHGKRSEYGMKAVRVIELKLKYAGILEETPGQPRAGSGDPVDLDEFRSDVRKEAAGASVSTH